MHVTLIAAQSVDGFITRHNEPGSGFTSAADKDYFRDALRTFDCRVMGAGTYRASRAIVRRTAAPERIQIVVTRTTDAFKEDVVVGALEFVDLSAKEILRSLEKRGYQRCALIGGSQVHHLFLAADCVDELWLTIEPVLFGSGTPFLSGEVNSQLERLSHELLSADTLLVKYRVIKGKS